MPTLTYEEQKKLVDQASIATTNAFSDLDTRKVNLIVPCLPVNHAITNRGWTCLHKACTKESETEEAQNFIKATCNLLWEEFEHRRIYDINKRDSFGKTPLIIAAAVQN